MKARTEALVSTAGWRTLAALALGLTLLAAYTIEVRAVPAAVTCAPASVTASANADAWIDQNSVDTNKGTDSVLKVMSKSPNLNFRALVRFTLPAVPAGCEVASATLRLYSPSATAGRTLQAVRLSGTWAENTVTWANQPATSGVAASTASGIGYRDWNVRDQVLAMYVPGANHGFLIRDAAENGGGQEQQLHSREKAPDNPPQLVVAFQPIPDTTAPNTTILTGPDAATTDGSATFTFTGDDNETPAEELEFECRLDGGPWASCASPWTIEDVTPGTHTFEVRAVDDAGNVDGTPASWTWTRSSGWTFKVNSTADLVDANVGDGICRSAANTCTLRAAVQEANARPGRDTIEVPAGLYTLAIQPDGENLDDTGDLDLTGSVTIVGDGSGATIVDGGEPGPQAPPEAVALDRVFEIHPTAGNVSLFGLTVRGGWSDEDGGAIHTTSNGTVRLVDVAVLDSMADGDGGGIYATGTVFVERSTISGNSAPEGQGGGIYLTSGALTVTGTPSLGSTISGNVAEDGGGIYHAGELTAVGLRSSVTVEFATLSDNAADEGTGGAVANSHEGILTVRDATLSGNRATYGGALATESKTSLTVRRTTVDGNAAVDEGGGAYIDTERAVTITDSVFSGNSTQEDAGGGILTQGTGANTLARLTVEGNEAGGEGGGIYLDNNGPVTLTDSTIRNNVSHEGGGGIQNAATHVTFTRLDVYGNRAVLDGGGIESQGSGDFYVVDSSIHANTAENGGGIANAADGRLFVQGSSVYGNRAVVGANDDTGLGGGIYVLGDAGIAIDTSTISGNFAQVRGGGLYVDADADIRVTHVTIARNASPVGSGVATEVNIPTVPPTPDDSLIFRNSLVAENRLGPNCNFAIFSDGGNLEDRDDCYFRGHRDRIKSPAELDALADNGGPTPTHALRMESMAVDSALNPCPLTDQRGVARPKGLRCDVGAYEYEGPFLPEDTTPPDTEFLGVVLYYTEATSAFLFTGTDDTTPASQLQFECRLFEIDPTEPPEPPDPTEPPDPEFDWHSCSSPYEVPLLDEGTWTFEVRALDRAWNVDPTPAVHTFTAEEDMTPPETFFTETPPNPSFGRSATFSFRGTDNLTPSHLLEFECRIDSNDPEMWLECSNPTVFTNLTTGTHTVEVRAVDLEENVDPTPARFTWTIADPVDCDAANITLTAVSDVYVDQLEPFANFVIEPQLVVRSNGPAMNARALYRFAIPDDAPDCVLESATLRLYAGSSTPDRTLQAIPLAGAWAENTVTWMNQPATTGEAAETSSGDGYREWDVTDHVASMRAGELENHGWLIRDAHESDPDGADQEFHSREVPQDPPPVTLPRLVLLYEAAGGPPPPPPLPATEETEVECGQVLTESTLLANDLLDCLGEGLVVGAPNIVVDLNGHTVTSGAPFEPGEEDGLIAGIRNAGHANVVIRNGTVRLYGYGVRLMGGAKYNVVEEMTLDANILAGVELFDADDGRNGNTVRNNTLTNNGESGIWLAESDGSSVLDNTFLGNGGVGILLQGGSANRIEGNEISGVIIDPLALSDSDAGMRLEGSRSNVVRGNSVADTGDGGILVLDGSRFTVVEDNTLVRPGDAGVIVGDSDDVHVLGNLAHLGSDAGVVLENSDRAVVRGNELGFSPSGVVLGGSSDALVEENDVSHSLGAGIEAGGSSYRNRILSNLANETGGEGIHIEVEGASAADGTLIEGNTANDNGGDGISVAAGAHRVTANAAHNNDGWGISAEEGVIDGGGNTASGNAEPLQCRGVVCTPGDAPPPVTPDHTPPTTEITLAPPNPSDILALRFEFTGSDDRTPPTALRFECRLDPPPDPPLPDPDPDPDPPEPGEPPEDPDPVDPTNPDTWENCVSPFIIHFLEEGEHRFEVRAVDWAGNKDYSGDAYYEWTVVGLPDDGDGDDTRPPNTTISAAPDDPSTSTTATFRFRGSDDRTPGVSLRYECRLDGGAWESCTSPLTYTGLALGEHSFAVRAIDLAGNADPTPATYTWTIEEPPPDETAPETTIDSGPDETTSATTATFTFSSNEADSTFECALDPAGDGDAAFTDADFEECGSPQTYTALAPGDHVFLVRAIDAAGNVDETPALWEWTITSAPLPKELSCGEVVTQSVLLMNDLLDCPEDGLVVGAPRITIDLNGFTVSGTGLGAGIRNEEHRSVSIVGGTVENFDEGVYLGPGTTRNLVAELRVQLTQQVAIHLVNADDGLRGNTIRDNLLSGNAIGIAVHEGTRDALIRANTIAGTANHGIQVVGSNRNRIVENIVTATADNAVYLEASSENLLIGNSITDAADVALELHLESNRNRVEGNTLEESDGGIIVSESEGNELIGNTASGMTDAGIKLENAHNGAVRGNDVRHNAEGIELDASTANLIEENNASQTSGDGIALGDHSLDNVVANNIANGNSKSGISVGPLAPPGYGNVLEGNTANGNGENGIVVEKVGHVIARNVANTNGEWGIYAAADSNGINVDGGGNRAMGNGMADQCFGVTCDGGAPLPTDPIPPETSILDGPPESTLLRSATFRFTGSDNATKVTFQCRLDGSDWAVCTSPKTYTGLAVGEHTFEVRAVDYSGNVDPTPAAHTWTINAPAPGVPPDTSIDEGPDPVTASTSATFSFSSDEPEVTFECSLDGGPWTACTTPKTYSGLSVGEHELRVRAIDPENLVDPTPATWNWRITAAPVAATVDCGQVLTVSTLVLNDLENCVGHALVVGAAGITVDLGGHRIDGVGQGAGVYNPQYANVAITNGIVSEFDYGVQLNPGASRNVVTAMTLEWNQDAGMLLSDADDAHVRANTIRSNAAPGIHLVDMQGAVVRDNVLTFNAGDGIVVEQSTGNRVELNRVTASSGYGVSVQGGGGNRVAENLLTSNASGGVSIGSVEAPTQGNLVQANTISTSGSEGISVVSSTVNHLIGNTVTANASGIELEASHDNVLRGNVVRANSGGIELIGSTGNHLESNDASSNSGGIELEGGSIRNTIVRNTASGNNGRGIYVADNAPAGQGNLIERNIASSNSDDGISVNGGGHLITGNIADFNDGWGIYASVTGMDGGGNFATGNAEPAQCFNVSCTIGVDPGAPDTEIILKPDDPSDSRNALFTFTGTDDKDTPAMLDFECRLDSTSDTAWVECENPAEYVVTPGQHTFEVRAIDSEGRIDASPASYTWTYVPPPTGVPPDTFIDLKPNNPTRLLEGIFTFYSDEPDVTFECQLDNGPWEPCELFYEFQFEEAECPIPPVAGVPCDQPYGEHTFRVRAIDIEGLVDPTPAEYTWTILGVITVFDSGPADETTETEATFEFHANVASPQHWCSLDLGEFVECTSPYTVTDLAVGGHLFRVWTVDLESGMTEEDPVEYEWEVILGDDTTPPDTIITLAPASGTSDVVFEFTGTDDRTFPELLEFECRLDSTLETDWFSCVSPFNLLAEFPDFAPGVHTFEVRAIDDADPDGNVDPTPASHTWTSAEDTTAPEVEILSASPGETAEIDFLFEFAGSDNATPVELLEFECALLLDGEVVEPFEPCDSPHSVQGLEPGAYELQVRAIDLAGNVGEPATLQWTVVGAPETTIDSGPDNPSLVAENEFTFSSDQPGSTFECRLNGGDWEPCSSPHTTVPLDNGEHEFEVRATNAYGLVDESPAAYEWVVDAAIETRILSGPPAVTAARTATFEFTANRVDATFECSLDGGGWASCDSPQEYGGLAEGAHTFAVRATDAEGNTDTTPAVHEWTITDEFQELVVTCGQVLAANTRVMNSLVNCPADGLVVGAAGVTIDLNGNSIGGDGLWLGSGILNPGFANVTILNGTVHRFADGISHEAGSDGAVVRDVALNGNVNAGIRVVQASEVLIEDVSVDGATGIPGLGSDAGIVLSGVSDSVVRSSSVTLTGDAGILLQDESERNLIEGNTLSQSGDAGILLEHSDNNQIVGNTAGFASDAGVALSHSNANVVRANTLGGGAQGVQAEDSTDNLIEQNAISATGGAGIEISGASAGTVVTANTISAAGDSGIVVEDDADPGNGALIVGNTSTGNNANGIYVAEAGHTVTANSANENGAWGIWAASPGTIDGGGNTAVDNAEPLQCHGVVCNGADTTPPTLELTGIDTSGNSITFTFTVDDNVTPEDEIVVECALDGAPFEACASPKTYTGLTGGPHTFVLRATDGDGNSSTATHEWEVEDNTPPVTTILSGPEEPSERRSATFTFQASEPGVEFECSLDGGGWTSCESPYELTGLGVGDHALAVRGEDPAGNVEPDPPVWVWTVLPDETAPTITFSSGPASLSGETTATFEFAAADHEDVTPADDLVLECRLDEGDWEQCESPVEYLDLADGLHLFEVRATDEAGNSAVESWTWTIVAAPVVTIDSGPDEVTSSQEAEFTFSADQAGVLFECELDGITDSGCTSPHAVSGLLPGAHTFVVRATNSFGRTGEAVWSWTVDLSEIPDEEAPETFFVPPLPTSPTISSDATFAFAGSDNVTAPADLAFECRLDSLVEEGWYACSSPEELTGLTAGQHTFEVRAADEAGNVDPTPAVHIWTILDVTPPEADIDTGPDELTSETTATFEFSGSDDVTPEELLQFECSLDSAAFTSCESPVTYDGLADGAHLFRVRAVDEAGNRTSPAERWSWTVDSAAPVVAVSGPPATTTDTNATIAFSAVDAVTAFEDLVLECLLDGAPVSPCESPVVLGGLSLGQHTFEVRATDEIGHTGSDAVTWTIEETDTAAPTTTIDTAPAAATAETTASFTFSADEPATFECSLDGAAFGPCQSGVSYSGLADGTHTFRVRATDAAGNQEDPGAEYAWTVDATAPDTTIESGPAALSASASATVTFSADEAASFECSLDGASYTACSSPAELTGLADGGHVFRVRAVDAVGNVDPTPAEHAWTVDTTAPQITLEGPSGDTTETTATFTFSADESATFECSLDGAAFEPCESPLALTGLEPGAHTFAVRATDPAGNVDPTPATHTWTIGTAVECGGPVTVASAADAWVDQGSPSANAGADALLRVVARNNANSRALVRFGLPAVPDGCVVESATLRLFAAAARNNRTLQALRVTDGWFEAGVTWADQPATAGPAATTSSGAGWREWSVTAQVQEMYGPAGNHGFLIRDASEVGNGFEQQFHSREKEENVPELVLTFRPEN